MTAVTEDPPVGAPPEPPGSAEAADAPAAGGSPAPSALRRRGRRAAVAALVAAVVAVVATGAGYGYEALAGDAGPPRPTLGPGDVTVGVGIEHSLFATDEIRVVEGTRVRFVVDNGDPIGHELITGPPEIHVQHANGTHPRHASVPGEVSVGPGEVGITTFTFDEPGEFEFACHLPRHYEYGMHGTVVVEPAER